MIQVNAQPAAGELLALEGEAFVRQAYLRLLDRPADPSGLQHYVAQLASGMTKDQLLAELESSPEARLVARRRGVLGQRGAASPRGAAVAVSHPQPAPRLQHVRDLLGFDGTDFVRQAYLAILGREADPSGLSYYGSRLASGEPKTKILADLRCDPEGQAYGSGLGGLDELVAAVARPAWDRPLPRDVDELLGLHGKEFVRAAYLVLFKREPDDDGLQNYLSVLRNGYSRSHVLNALASSPECQEKSGDLPGLARHLEAYLKGQRPNWSGWYWRNVKGAESDLPAAREARRLASAPD